VALNRALGLPPDRRIEIPKDILPESVDPPSEGALFANLPARRLDLVALRLGYRSQEQAVRTAILEQFPSFSIGGNAARDTGNVGTLGLGFSIGIPLFDRNRGAIAGARATRRQLFDEYVDRVHQARCDVAASLATIRSLNEQIAAAKAALPELQTLVETYRTAVESGQADVLSYYQALAELASRQTDVLGFEESLAEERTTLELATGLYDLDVAAEGKVSP
jgi:outer membrane protein TolC